MNRVFEKIETKEAPLPIGPYSQAIIAGPILSISGQIAIDPYTGRLVDDDIEKQARQVVRNIEAIRKKGHKRLKELGIDDKTEVDTGIKVFFRRDEDLKSLKRFCSSRFPQKINYWCVDGLPKNSSVEIRYEEKFPDFLLRPMHYYRTPSFSSTGNCVDVIKRIESDIKHHGFGLQRVFYTEVMLKDMKNYEDFNRKYAPFFPQRPSRAVVQKDDLKSDTEMSCRAYLGSLDG